MGDKASQLTSFLNGGNPQNGLSVALSNPPYTAAPAAKAKDVEAVVALLCAVKEPQMGPALTNLSVDEIDILAKYIYKGLESGNNSQALFKWFAALQTRAGGLGHLVRVLTDENKL